MPFTPAHILAVIPFSISNKKLPLSALAIGAVVPDFTMFFPFSSYHYSHSLSGLIFYCLPFGTLLLVFYHLLAKPFLIDLSPRWARRRLLSTLDKKSDMILNTDFLFVSLY